MAKMNIQTSYSEVDRLYYIRLYDGKKEIAQLGYQKKKPSKQRVLQLFKSWSNKNIKIKSKKRSKKS